MRIIARSRLRAFWESEPASREALKAWFAEVKKARWESPAELKRRYATASILPGKRVVFNIAGNSYRLVVRVNYRYLIVYVRFVGTHEEYDRINAETV